MSPHRHLQPAESDWPVLFGVIVAPANETDVTGSLAHELAVRRRVTGKASSVSGSCSLCDRPSCPPLPCPPPPPSSPLRKPAPASRALKMPKHRGTHDPSPVSSWRFTKVMNMSDLSRDDDFLSHLFVEKLGTGNVPLFVHKMDSSRRLPKTDASDILQIVRRVRSFPPYNPNFILTFTRT